MLTDRLDIENQAKGTAHATKSDGFVISLIAAGLLMPVNPASAVIQQPYTIQQNYFPETYGLLASVLNFSAVTTTPQRYSVVSRAKFTSYTSRFPFLVDLLYDASQSLCQIFPGDTIYRLEVRHDLEDENIEELVCFICTTLEPNIALEKLDAFDDAWFLDNIDKTKGRLIFTLAFNDI